MGRGRLHSCLLFIRLCVSTLYSDNGCYFRQVCYEVHGACDVRINLYPAAPIRLAKVLLAWTIAQEGWGLIFGTADRQVPICDWVLQPHIRPGRHTRLGVSELSALSTLSREDCSLRNQTVLEITPEGNGELARHCNDHNAFNAPGLPFGPLHEPLGNRTLGLMLDP
jgi:hypothetical protein